MSLNFAEAGAILFIPDICGVIISRYVLGAKGVARHVCEIVGRHLTGKTNSGICSVSKVYRVVSNFLQDTNGGGYKEAV